MIAQMCSNRAIDSLECCIDDLLECFEDFIRKSLLLIFLGIGVIVGLLCYLLKLVSERPPLNSAMVVTENTLHTQSKVNEITERNKRVEQEVKSNKIIETKNKKTDKIDTNKLPLDTNINQPLNKDTNQALNKEIHHSLNTDIKKTLGNEKRKSGNTDTKQTLEQEIRQSENTDKKQTLDKEKRQSGNTDTKQTLDKEIRKFENTDTKQTADNEKRQSGNTDTKQTADKEKRPSGNTNTKQTADKENRQSGNTDTKPTADKEKRPSGNTDTKQTLDKDVKIDLDKDKTTTTMNTSNLPMVPSFDENVLREVGLSSCSKYACGGGSSTHIYIPSRVPIPSTPTTTSKHKLIPCLRKRSLNKSNLPSLQICPRVTTPGSCCSMCCDDEPKRNEDLAKQILYRNH